MRHASASGAVTFTRSDPATLAVRGELTFATVTEALAAGRRALGDGTPMQLDLGGVARVDSAGLACVLALVAGASRDGHELCIRNWPAGLQALAEVCGVAEMLGAPRVAG